MSAQKSAFARIANLDKTKLATHRVNLSFVSDMVEITQEVVVRLGQVSNSILLMQDNYEKVEKAKQELIFEVNDAATLMESLDDSYRALNVAMNNYENAAKELGISPGQSPDFDKALTAYEDSTEMLSTLKRALDKYENI